MGRRRAKPRTDKISKRRWIIKHDDSTLNRAAEALTRSNIEFHRGNGFLYGNPKDNARVAAAISFIFK